MMKRVQRTNSSDKDSDSPTSGNGSMDQEILSTLKQINAQLKTMQIQPQDGMAPNTLLAPEMQQQFQSTGNKSPEDEELSELFSKLIENKAQQSQYQQQSSLPSAGNGKTVETAKQILAQAQYELANELEQSLQKLKQVISESEKIANKISNLLGQGSQGQKH